MQCPSLHLYLHLRPGLAPELLSQSHTEQNLYTDET
jgi:hypothetical protein